MGTVEGYPTEKIELCHGYQTERKTTIAPLGSWWGHHHICLFFFPGGGVPEGRVYGRRLVFVSERTIKRHHHHLLLAFSLPPAVLHTNITHMRMGTLEFTDEFRAACTATPLCHFRYAQQGNGMHFMTSCDTASQNAARTWLRLALLEYSAEDLEQQSIDDLTFGRLMPKGYITAKDKIDKTVWTARFFALVKSEVDNYVGLHKLTWSVKFGTYARGTLIMCSRKMRAWLLDDKKFAEYYSRQTSEENKLKVMRAAIINTTSAEGDSYMSQFQNLIKNPASYADKQNWKFKDIIEWQKSFHILQPITDEKYVRPLLQRLRNSGLSLNETVCAEQFTKVSPGEGVAEGSTEAPKRFHNCSCGRYRHYLWCLHVMLRATHDSLVETPYCPPNLDTTKVKNLKDRAKEKGKKGEGGKRKRKEREGGSCFVGRPTKARKGGGLSSDQGCAPSLPLSGEGSEQILLLFVTNINKAG
jgi:hypothetical protein